MSDASKTFQGKKKKRQQIFPLNSYSVSIFSSVRLNSETRQSASSFLSVCPHVSEAPNGRIFVKIHIGGFHENMLRK